MYSLLKTSLVFLSLLSLQSCTNNAETKTLSADASTSKEMEKSSPEKLLRHVVLFNFNDDATDEILKTIESAFVALPSKISAIHSFEWGTNNSPEGLDKGLTHCFFVTFASEADRATYLPHPAHQDFVKLIGPYVEDVTVVDYWTEG